MSELEKVYTSDYGNLHQRHQDFDTVFRYYYVFGKAFTYGWPLVAMSEETFHLPLNWCFA